MGELELERIEREAGWLCDLWSAARDDGDTITMDLAEAMAKADRAVYSLFAGWIAAGG